MERQLEIAVAIPTYNRLENLRECVKKFDLQMVPDSVNLSLVISNSASIDGTSEYLNELTSTRKNVHVFNKILDWVGGNYGCILEALPPKIDWVWFMGDDDEFCSPKSIQKISDLIFQNRHNKDFAFIHACDEARTRNTGSSFIDTTMNLCKKFGYLEMLGWFTSLVVRRTEFEASLIQIHQRATVMRGRKLAKTPYSAFFHSSYLLENLHEKVGAFFDEPLVREQPSANQTKTEIRWQNENMGERYLFVVDDFQRLIKSNLPLKNLPSEFFKYHKYHLWDRFIIFQIDAALEIAQRKDPKLIATYNPQFQKNWQRIELLATMLAKSETQKWLIILSRTIQEQCETLFNRIEDTTIRALLINTRKYLTLGCYDYKLDHSERQIFQTKI
tara:strand:- start:2418 stop:3581 length:1164 start_codon:yes stop_codon:yes gene_type:complete